jgi:hypothetical protein
MFFSFLRARKTRMIVVLLACAALALGMLGCKTEADEDTGNLVGTWKSPGEWGMTYVIAAGAIQAPDSGYEGRIENTPDLTASNGVLIIKFTKYAASYGGTPSDTHANVGKYGALYWKDLTADSVSLADAYNKDYTHSMKSSLSDAQTAFALGNMGDYIDWSITTPYQKQ